MINYKPAFLFRVLFRLQLQLRFTIPIKIKMKTKVAFTLLAGFLLVSGSKISTINNFVQRYTSAFTYNTTNGAIVTLVQNGVKYEYYYSADTVWEDQVNALGQTTNQTKYIVNSSGYADTAQGELISQNTSYAYTYDANGMLTQVKTYTNHVLTKTDIYTNNSAKNLVEVQHIPASTNISTYDYYTYYTSNTNTIGVQNMGQYYLGVSSTNLVETDVQIAANLDTADIITWHYFYDGSGNVDTAVAYHTYPGNTSLYNALADSSTYTYY
jgi:hypothetical protein